jgi:hypothetical protein
VGFTTTIPIVDLKCTLHQHPIHISDSTTTTATPPSSKEHHTQINIQTTQSMWSYRRTGTRSLMKPAVLALITLVYLLLPCSIQDTYKLIPTNITFSGFSNLVTNPQKIPCWCGSMAGYEKLKSP